MSFRIALKKLPRNATIKRIFRYSQARNYPIDPHNLINYYTAQKLLEECPHCLTKKSKIASTVFGPKEYQKCRGKKCIKEWVVYGPKPDTFFGPILAVKGPYWKAIVETLRRPNISWVTIEEKEK